MPERVWRVECSPADARGRIQKWRPPTPARARQRESAKMVPACASNPERVPTNFCTSRRWLKVSKWISLIYGLGAFQSAAFALGPGTNESVCEPKSGISVPYRPMFLLECKPHWFLMPGILRAHLSGARPKGWVPDVGTYPNSSGRSSVFVRFPLAPPDCRLLHWGWGFWRDLSLLPF